MLKEKTAKQKARSQLDAFEQNVIFGDVANSGQQSVAVNNGSVDQKFTLKNGDGIPTTNENVVNVLILERCFNGKINKQMGNLIDTVKKKIQNAILTSIDSFINAWIELAVKSKNGSSKRDVARITL